MEAEFWHDRWKNNHIPFHEKAANPLLIKYFNVLDLPKNSRVFLPLCGKTLDIPWLLSNGYRVTGAELSTIAIEQLFAELNIKPAISRVGELDLYSADNLDIFVGNIFKLARPQLGQVDGIYDRAALVALPEAMRIQYAAHLMDITQRAPQLLICFEYDQNLLAGPPFSVPATEVHQHYRDHYHLSLLSNSDLVGGLKGKCPTQEQVWLLTKKL